MGCAATVAAWATSEFPTVKWKCRWSWHESRTRLERQVDTDIRRNDDDCVQEGYSPNDGCQPDNCPFHREVSSTNSWSVQSLSETPAARAMA